MFDIYLFIDIFNLFKYIFFKNLEFDWIHTEESRKTGEQVGNTVCTATLKDSTIPSPSNRAVYCLLKRPLLPT